MTKFKLDENLGCRTQRLFEAAGYDCQTVRQEGLQGVGDQRLYDQCATEQRCLVTLDLDFADVLRFPPAQSGGIVILRASRTQSLALLEEMVRQLIHALRGSPVEPGLWVVELGRIRIHQAATS